MDPRLELLMKLFNVVDPKFKQNLENNKKLLDSCDDSEETKYPLHVAVLKDNRSRLEFYLDSGMNPNSPDADGNTPLHDALKYERMVCVEMLLLAGADPMRPNKKEVTPLESVIISRNEKYLELFMTFGFDLSLLKNHRNLLTWSFSQVFHKNTNPVLDLLLATKTNLSNFCLDGSSPLHVAVLLRNTDAAAILLANGADPNYRDVLDKTALQLAPLDLTIAFEEIFEKFPFSLQQLCLYKIRLMDIQERITAGKKRIDALREERGVSYANVLD